MSPETPESLTLRDALLALLLVQEDGLDAASLGVLLGEHFPGQDWQAIADDLCRSGWGPLGLHRDGQRYRLRLGSEWNPLLVSLLGQEPRPLSKAAMETLAIIAYQQPITRPEMEQWRGVSINPSVLQQLRDLQWIEVQGHKDSPGRPALWGTTAEFLRHFALGGLQDLPIPKPVAT